MSVIKEVEKVKEIYERAGKKEWTIPCFCSENLTTTEAVLGAAEELRVKNGLDFFPVIIAMTCLYPHRSQAVNYTHTKRWDTGIKLFTESVKILCEPGGPFENLDVMIHLDHIQHDLDMGLLSGDLSDYASILYDASELPLEQNIEKTAAFVKKRGGEIVVEGACDEITNAGGESRNDFTAPENALRYFKETGAELIVCNLGTEHRASGKDLEYRGDISRKIKEQIGSRIVLHGTSSVSNEQVKGLYGDGVCKVNIWTALERDSSPALFADMARHAGEVAGKKTTEELAGEGILTNAAADGKKININYFTALYRQTVVFEKMKEIAKDYFRLWYGL